VTEWLVLSHCPRQYEWSFLRASEVEREREFEAGKSAFEAVDAAELGTRVHALLQQWGAWTEFYNEDQWRAELLSLAEEAGPRRLNAKVVADWVAESSWMRRSQEGFEVWSELGFEAPLRIPERPLEVLIGTIDRLVCNHAGTDDASYTLIDFKVTGRAKSPELLLETYKRQIELYAWALHQLEPESRGRTRAFLVQISAEGVREVEVPLEKWISSADSVAHLAREYLAPIDQITGAIVQNGRGEPRPSARCANCDFVTLCPEGGASLPEKDRPKSVENSSQD
jgi:hypothetical protein